MSVITSRKSLNSSILKASRLDSIKKTKTIRFEVNLTSVKGTLKELEDNPNAKSYQNLIYKLSQADVTDEELRKIVTEATESISLITKDHLLLVQSLLGIRWIKRDADIVQLFHDFILNLLTSKSDFLVLCLSKIIGCFIPDDEECDLWTNGAASAELSAKLELVHGLMKKILDVMPMIPVTLRKQIRLEFPYFKQNKVKIVSYIVNLLELIEYCPNMIHDVIELLLEQMLLIDVNVSREQIEQSEEDDELWLDDDEAESDKMRLPVAETLDICMEKILEFFHTKLKDDSEANRSDQKAMVEAIFNYFNEHIIKTYTKHVHFILFYIASLRKTFLTEFLNYLWTKVIDRNQSSTIRQTSIGYLSSFLSRAKFLSQDTLRLYLKKLSEWAHCYVRTCDFSRVKNPKAHVVFYSVCQAIFYIIAFRSRELTNSDRNLEFLLQLNLWPVIKHPLNPLNCCLPAIATIFDNITTKYQILFCHTILVNNASKSLTMVFGNEQHRPEEVLESVFPFDPYLLKKSGKRIHPLYIEYQPEEGAEDDGIDSAHSSAHNSPRRNLKRTRNESTSCDLEDFIIREHKNAKA